jgi:hypothetical protein
MYVSLTGVLIYLLLYHVFPQNVRPPNHPVAVVQSAR